MSKPDSENLRKAFELAGDVTLHLELAKVLERRVKTREDATAVIYSLVRLAVCMAGLGTNEDEVATRNCMVMALNMNLKSHADAVKWAKGKKP